MLFQKEIDDYVAAAGLLADLIRSFPDEFDGSDDPEAEELSAKSSRCHMELVRKVTYYDSLPVGTQVCSLFRKDETFKIVGYALVMEDGNAYPRYVVRSDSGKTELLPVVYTKVAEEVAA